jgi:tryptophan-rich sensory protein
MSYPFGLGSYRILFQYKYSRGFFFKQMLSSTQAIAIWNIAGLVSGYWRQIGIRRKSSAHYKRTSKHIRCAPPRWVFGPVWFLLDLLIITSVYVFLGSGDYDGTPHFVSVFTLVSVNLVLKGTWPELFWDNDDQYGASLVAIIVMVGTGVAISVLFAVSDAWLAFGLFVPYVAWITFATFLNYQYWMLQTKPVTRMMSVIESSRMGIKDDTL